MREILMKKVNYFAMLLLIVGCGDTSFERKSSPMSDDLTCTDSFSSVVPDLVAEINRVRIARGLRKVTATAGLNCAAQRHAKDIGSKRVCSHTGSDGSSPWTRAKGCGAKADGEIIACGHRTAAQAVKGWTNSPGHAAIMYNPNQTFVGAAMVNNYWVVDFL